MSPFSLVARLSVLCLVATAIIGQLMAKRAPANMIVLELPASESEVRSTLAESGAQATSRRSIAYDGFFILAYGLLFLTYAALYALHPAPSSRWLAVATAIAAGIAVVFDVIENRHILTMIDQVAANASTIDLGVYRASAVKWIAYFAVILLIAPLFTRSTPWILAIAALFALAGAAGVLASLALPWTWQARTVVFLAVRVSTVPLLLAAIVLAARPAMLLPK